MKTKVMLFGRILLCVLLAVVALVALGQIRSVKAAGPSIYGLHVSGNQLQNQYGETIRLRGVNRSGTEYMCVNGYGFFDGPSDAASVDAIANWNVNVVRVPLNEDCWLNINGSPWQYSGDSYRQAISNYVNLLNSRNIIAILDLHWAAPGGNLAVGQRAMPNADHSYDFWWSVADTFKSNSAVIFDLYNEPYPENWDCWRNGSSGAYSSPCSEIDYAVAGMQGLVSTVRNAGANNVLMLGGLGYANWIQQLYDYLPYDGSGNVMAAVHNYNFSGCADVNCTNNNISPVKSHIPVVFGELGEGDCQHWYVDGIMDWADQNGVGYLGWAWNTADCSGFPALISDYNGTPTNFGIGFKNRFSA